MDAFERMYEKRIYTDTFIRFNNSSFLIPVHAVILSGLKYFEKAMSPEWHQTLERTESGKLIIPINIDNCTSEAFSIVLGHIYDLDICKKYLHCTCDRIKIDILREAGKACDFLGATTHVEHFSAKILERRIETVEDVLSIYQYAQETESDRLELRALLRAAESDLLSAQLIRGHSPSGIVNDLHMLFGWNESVSELIPTERLLWDTHSRVVQVTDLNSGESNVCGTIVGKCEKQAVWIVRDVLKLVFETSVDGGNSLNLKIWMTVGVSSVHSIFDFFPSIGFVFGTSSPIGSGKTQHEHRFRIWEDYKNDPETLAYGVHYKKSSDGGTLIFEARMGIGYPIKIVETRVFFALEGLVFPEVYQPATTTTTHGVKRKAESDPIVV